MNLTVTNPDELRAQLSALKADGEDMQAVNRIVGEAREKLHTLGYSKEKSIYLFARGGYPEAELEENLKDVARLTTKLQAAEEPASVPYPL
ncbi:hypothetical protein [Arsenicibacter rosenii]|uniref:Uncharacterized protein n=1 Tax=Arsenicibacter rosenii TaxID=1750698 RepID=A0A1S2VBP5_9BACT|nr:hypothetical protein [Arsenicibacter rosenii]OIN55840.1 hypothetical protein BLX24_27680 [Arsenicibacter rosenii]